MEHNNSLKLNVKFLIVVGDLFPCNVGKLLPNIINKSE